MKVMRKKGNDQQVKKVLIVKQILHMSTIENVWRTVWRIQCMHDYVRVLRVNELHQAPAIANPATLNMYPAM